MGATWVAEYGGFKIIGCCLMGNHLLAKTLPEYKFSDQDIKKRYVSFYVLYFA